MFLFSSRSVHMQIHRYINGKLDSSGKKIRTWVPRDELKAKFNM